VRTPSDDPYQFALGLEIIAEPTSSSPKPGGAKTIGRAPAMV
jgi:hypothetical protein